MMSQQEMLACMSDLTKDALGYRLRNEDLWLGMSDAELRVEWNYWAAQVGAALQRDAAEQAAALAKWEAHIRQLMRAHKLSRANAVRWDMQAMQIGRDVTQYCYDWGIDTVNMVDTVKRQLKGR